jgi:glutamate carboxypeptidase
MIRLKQLGASVEFIDAQDTMYRMSDTPLQPGRMVKATLKGKGVKNILLIAHMDTVCLKGMLAKQPFRINEDRAYGLGIADDKQGIALIIHTIEILNKIHFKDYGQLTILITGDEEISSPASRAILTSLGATNDVILSGESATTKSDLVELATAGIALVDLNITGKASHAGSAPEQGRNA